MTDTKLSLQDIILTLQQYWAKQGANLMQAYDNEVGAGTQSPYTFCAQMVQSHGMLLMYNHHGDRLMDVMVTIQIVFFNIINFKL